MFDQAGEFNLLVTLASKSDGAFLSDVEITLRDDGGRSVLDSPTFGRLFWLDLPKGRYILGAELEGWERIQPQVDVGSNQDAIHVTMSRRRGR
jgi:hypothetical protein